MNGARIDWMLDVDLFSLESKRVFGFELDVFGG